MTSTADEVAAKIEAALVRRSVQRITLGLGSILLIDFRTTETGKPVDSGPALPYVRVECAWRLEDKESVLVASEDSRESMALSLGVLRSRVVREVDVSLPAFDLRIRFDSGHALLIFPIYANSDDYENWTIQTTSNEDIISGPGRRIQVVPSDG